MVPPYPLPIVARRRGRRMAYWNGALWALGNGLASTPLVVYLALELDAPALGLGTGLILAAPSLVGVLRMAAPALVERSGSRKKFCLRAFVVSLLLLALLPFLAAPGRLASPVASLATLVILWCVYHLFQYLATVALWSWLADLVPLRVRGRFLGRRERWMVLGEAAGMLTAGLYVWGQHALRPDQPTSLAYVPPMLLGVAFMLAAVVPLAAMPRVKEKGDKSNYSCRRVLPRADRPVHNWTYPLFLPFADASFRRLLLFGCWFSFFNGITQSAMMLYTAKVLLFGVLVVLALKTAMRIGQWGVSPAAGRLADRLGNRPVLMVSLLLVAQGPLFYLMASPAHPWWIAGAWLVWIAYAGLNVALPNLMLKLSPRDANLPYIAAYYTVTGLCYAASTIAGGALHDRLRYVTLELPWGVAWDAFAWLFFAGWIARMLAAVVLLSVIEEKGDILLFPRHHGLMRRPQEKK